MMQYGHEAVKLVTSQKQQPTGNTIADKIKQRDRLLEAYASKELAAA